jgi:hypothetical protein
MKRPSWQVFFPRSWRERYGEEFDQLLEDLDEEHRLTAGTALNVAGAGIRLHSSRPDGRVRFAAGAAVVLVVLLGVVLGLSLSIATTGLSAATFVAPPLQPHAGPAIPSDVVINYELYVQCESNTLALQQLASGRTSGVAWSIAVPRTTPGGTTLVDRLAYGDLTIEGTRLPLCSIVTQSVRFGSTGNAIPLGAHFNVINVDGRAVAYGLIPEGDNVVIRGLGDATHPVLIRKGIWDLSLFLATFQKSLCGDVALHVQGSSLQLKWVGESQFNSSGCSVGRPLDPVGYSTKTTGLRNIGKVTRIGGGVVFVTDPGWPTLRVQLSSSTRIYSEKGAGESRLPNASYIRPGDSVYVSGVIGATSAQATAIYIFS